MTRTNATQCKAKTNDSEVNEKNIMHFTLSQTTGHN